MKTLAGWLLLLLPMSGIAGDLPLIQTVFVIVMENHNWSSLKGSRYAPYLNNTLLPMASYCAQYYNPPGLHPSLPNYLWLEAGTNFGIRNDNDPSSNHQRTTNHLVTLLKNAGVSWKAYQEDISGLYVPLTSTNKYTPRHNPFVYFDDVTGTNNVRDAYGIAHVRPYRELAADLTNNTVARYNFITPNLCNDTHDSCPPLNNPIRQGDNWLAAEVPKILDSQAYKNGGALFITWDEGENSDGPIGMIVLSRLARGGGYFNTTRYTHSSFLRSLQEILGVTPLLGEAARATNLSDLFTRVPVAQCTEVVVSAGENCLADASVNNGSFDPDGDPITVNQSPGGPYAPGTNVVTLTVTDSHGAASSCLAKVIVLDTRPPAIACPAAIFATNAHDAWRSVIMFEPSVSDNCSGISTLICDPPSGSAFELGAHNVTCSVTDWAGNAGQCSFEVTVWPGNQPPLPSIEVSPLANFPDNTDLVLISTDNTSATVVFDGSKSYDQDDVFFKFLWQEGTTVFSTEAVTTNILAIGSHEITLLLNDTFPLGTNSASVTLEVISLSAAVGLVARVAEGSSLPRRTQQPLLASLMVASASFAAGHSEAGIQQLEAFQNKLPAQVSRLDPALADKLNSATQVIIDAFGIVTTRSSGAD